MKNVLLYQRTGHRYVTEVSRSWYVSAIFGGTKFSLQPQFAKPCFCFQFRPLLTALPSFIAVNCHIGSICEKCLLSVSLVRVHFDIQFMSLVISVQYMRILRDGVGFIGLNDSYLFCQNILFISNVNLYGFLFSYLSRDDICLIYVKHTYSLFLY